MTAARILQHKNTKAGRLPLSLTSNLSRRVPAGGRRSPAHSVNGCGRFVTTRGHAVHTRPGAHWPGGYCSGLEHISFEAALVPPSWPRLSLGYRPPLTKHQAPIWLCHQRQRERDNGVLPADLPPLLLALSPLRHLFLGSFGPCRLGDPPGGRGDANLSK